MTLASWMASKRQRGARIQKALPNEILEEIFAFCPTSDLVQLAIANRRMSNIASHFLYHTIPELASDKLIAFLTTMYFYEHRAPSVRSFSICPVANWKKSWIFQPVSGSDIYHIIKKVGMRKTYDARHIFQSHHTLLAAVLKKLRNLTFLELYLYLSHSDWVNGGMESLLNGCTFQLGVLHTSFPLDRGLSSFVETQPSLRELVLDFNHSLPLQFANLSRNFPLPASSLPSLTTVGWSGIRPSMETVRSLIEGRPVYSIVIHLSDFLAYDNPNGDSILKDYIDIGPYENQIEDASVSFGDASFSRKHMSTLRTVFTSLRYLSLHFSELIQEIFDEIAASVHEFDKLEHLGVSGSPSNLKRSKLSITTEICFDRSDALDTIDVSVHKSEIKMVTLMYRRENRLKPVEHT